MNVMKKNSPYDQKVIRVQTIDGKSGKTEYLAKLCDDLVTVHFFSIR